ncbi:hypothetical protein [Haladaptatus sp. GCM10025893]|uniref:hypothetical protein n=1 Tax=Haladaptatus sp. GCM10025893 TaxID=3252659 RepID=UPI00361F6343
MAREQGRNRLTVRAAVPETPALPAFTDSRNRRRLARASGRAASLQVPVYLHR